MMWVNTINVEVYHVVRMYKKAQLEMIGLAMLVLLLSFGIILLTQCSSESKEMSMVEEFTDRQITGHYLNSLLQITVPACNDASMEVLLQDCAAGEILSCTGGARSCFYANKTLIYIFEKTLIEYKKEFLFSVTKTPIYIMNGDCSAFRESSRFIIPSDAGVMVARMDVCRSATYTGFGPEGLGYAYISDIGTCQIAESNLLCDGLDIAYGAGYKASCCIEHDYCC